MITLDDLIEEIVGEIRERGEAPPDFEIVNEDTIQLRGRMELDYVNEEFDLDLIGDKNVTLGGYLCEQLGHIPQPGETYQEGSLWFKVVNLKGRRIGQVLISRKGIGKQARIRGLDRS